MLLKFRKGEIGIIITTDLLARGIDVPAIDFTVNFDIPIYKIGNKYYPNFDIYLHRIGRAGRFGSPGACLTLYDRGEDE